MKTCATSRAGIALGSNLGDRLLHLKTARERVRRLPGVGPPLLASSVYETVPVGCEPNTPKFLNTVIEVGWTGEPLELLRELRQIEAACGRPMAHPRNSSRTLDLDLLYCGNAHFSQPELELPHPRLRERRFVLEPLTEIRPELQLRGESENVAALLRRLPPSASLLRIASQW